MDLYAQLLFIKNLEELLSEAIVPELKKCIIQLPKEVPASDWAEFRQFKSFENFKNFS